ncbi:MAG TPA: response regulator [Candidatus Udaeobacter sp.]|nr:response regulator [Candidatus Udaeobacter sp.]
MDAPRPSLICLLDDDPSVLRGLNRLLMSVGWQPEQFSDPDEFLNYVKVHRPTVAIIDVWMPLMNGLEVQSRVRELSPSTRVIMFTGKDDPLVRCTSLKAGASAFFTKPFDDEEFLTAVRFALCGM